LIEACVKKYCVGGRERGKRDGEERTMGGDGSTAEGQKEKRG
jgi:hypothetical protein